MAINEQQELKYTYNPYYVKSGDNLTPNWNNGDDNGDDNTPIIAEALNQLERQLKAVYDAVGKIDVDVEPKTPLQSAVTNYKNSVDTKFSNLLDLDNDESGQTAKKATTAKELDEEPELTATGNNTIQITAGGKTSDEFTVPFATETSKLQNPIKITLTGDVTGSVDTQFDKSTSINTQLNAPVVTYQETGEENINIGKDEIVFVCGDAQPYIPTN